MKEITFGQYYPVTSFVHKIDARIKILTSIAFIVAVFLIREYYFWGYAVAGGFILIACIFGRLPIGKVLGSIKAVFNFCLTRKGKSFSPGG
ncbi:MAG: hypothetical protein MJ072_04585 [Clostridia bacterium]|nr:hypothetical protein [Clostridia bacterium]